MSTVVITSDIGCEMAFGAFAKFIMSNATFCMLPIGKLKEHNCLDDYCKENPSTIVCFGDFWSDEYIAEISTKYKQVNIVHINYGGSPFKQLVNLILSLEGFHHDLVEFGFEQNFKLIEMIEQRCRGENTLKTQPLVTGISNVLVDVPIEERYSLLFRNKLLKLEDVLNLGSKIMESQIQIAKERTLKNSRTGTFKDGTAYAITDAPELVNLTHDALRERYGCQVTVIASLKFKEGGPDEVSHSMRSYDNNIDVRAMVKPFGGSGTVATTGACRKVINIEVDY